MTKGQIKISLSVLALFAPFMSLKASSYFFKAPADSSFDINIEINSSPTVETNIVRYYFIDQSWWNDAAAESWVYIWNSTKTSDNYKLSWPGEMMTHISYNSSSRQNTWYIDIDLDLYDRCIVSRNKTQDDGSVANWGAQTVDITLTKEFNTITLCENASWGTASVTTSYIKY